VCAPTAAPATHVAGVGDTRDPAAGMRLRIVRDGGVGGVCSQRGPWGGSQDAAALRPTRAAGCRAAGTACRGPEDARRVCARVVHVETRMLMYAEGE